MKFNQNYYHNEKYNHEKIAKIVKELMAGDLNISPFDFLFRYNARNYPKTFHNELNLPGKFKRIEDTAVFVRGNGVLQMDYAESVTPCGFVKRDAVNNVEHQTGILRDEKIQAIFNYCLYTTIQLKKPCYPIVVTNYNYKEKFKTYCIEGVSLTVRFRIFDEKNVYKIFNTLSEKNYNQIEFSNEDYVKFIFALIFPTKHYAKDVVEKMAYLFASIEKINFTNQLDLHLALKMTIKYHFRDDEKKIKELLTVITQAVHESRTDEISCYEVKQKTIEELKQENSDFKAELSKKDTELSKKDAEISYKDAKLSKKDAEILKLKDKIKSLENLIGK